MELKRTIFYGQKHILPRLHIEDKSINKSEGFHKKEPKKKKVWQRVLDPNR